MRRIISKKEQERLAKRNQTIIGVVLIALMLFSVLGYSFVSSPDDNEEENGTQNINYNGYSFVYQNGYWITSLNDNNLIFNYGPEDINHLSISLNLSKYEDKDVYIYSEDIESRSALKYNIGEFSSSIEDVCYEGKECDSNLPVKSCDDNLILVLDSPESSIATDKNCLIISGPENNILKETNTFLYNLFDIV